VFGFSYLLFQFSNLLLLIRGFSFQAVSFEVFVIELLFRASLFFIHFLVLLLFFG
jgi:hypothetical protein